MAWTNTVNAVVDAETSSTKSQWRIGDAIEKDLKELVSSKFDEKGKIYDECSNLLKDKGYNKYDAWYLGKLHRTAEAFSRNERDARYAWDTHYEAGTPDNLRQAAAALHKLKKTVTVPNVRWLMRQWREKAKEERLAANEAACLEKEAAKKKKAKAAADALKAKNKADKDKAKETYDQAKQDEKEAKEREKQTASTPAYNTDVATELQDQDTLRAMAIYAGVILHTQRMQKEADATLKDLDKIAEHLTSVQIREISAACEQVIVLCREIKSKASGKPHLRSVEGGAA